MILASLWNFDLRSQAWGGSIISGPSRNWSLTFPDWIIFIIVLIVPVSVILRAKKIRLSFRNGVTRLNPRLQTRIIRFGIFSIAGATLGVLIGAIDVKLEFSQSDNAWALMLVTLLPIATLIAVSARRRIPWHRAVLWMALELGGCVCFFESTVDLVWHSHGINRASDLDLLLMILYTGIICFIFGAIFLFFLQVKPEPVKPGPYCPECGYCLIGSPRPICSECGRPFSLEELGIVQADLVPHPQTQ